MCLPAPPRRPRLVANRHARANAGRPAATDEAPETRWTWSTHCPLRGLPRAALHLAHSSHPGRGQHPGQRGSLAPEIQRRLSRLHWTRKVPAALASRASITIIRLGLGRVISGRIFHKFRFASVSSDPPIWVSNAAGSCRVGPHRLAPRPATGQTGLSLSLSPQPTLSAGPLPGQGPPRRPVALCRVWHRAGRAGPAGGRPYASQAAERRSLQLAGLSRETRNLKPGTDARHFEV